MTDFIAALADLILPELMGGYAPEYVPGGNLYFNYTDYLSQQNDVSHLNISEFYLRSRGYSSVRCLKSNYSIILLKLYPTSLFHLHSQ